MRSQLERRAYQVGIHPEPGLPLKETRGRHLVSTSAPP